ncbi:hypothetical protein BDN72DRAFT_861096 [Pluteus cervinus]|uniref:Uncharacterized protein n=1 Tax=Pluteus cervinus TaxID=181527 RepID=A0ACD3AH95_9AGAR|nr:hypothetical protein BDN72DRAFT_861096 [Pluteus cervinus]
MPKEAVKSAEKASTGAVKAAGAGKRPPTARKRTGGVYSRKGSKKRSNGARAPRRGTEGVDMGEPMEMCAPEVPAPALQSLDTPVRRRSARVQMQAKVSVVQSVSQPVVGFEIMRGIGPAPDGETDDYCSVCNDGGDMRTCQKCPRSFCNNCLPVTRDEFLCPQCAGIIYPYTGKPGVVSGFTKEDIIETDAVYNSMMLLPACSSEPLMILNFHLSNLHVTQTPAILVFYHITHYLRSNIAMVNIPISLLNVAEEEEFAKRMADLVDKLENELKKFRRFAVFITTHSDPDRGDLHVVAGNRCSEGTKRCFEFLFPARLRSILKERGRENIMFLLVCGAVVKHRESLDGIIELGKEDLFGSIVAFDQDRLQYMLGNLFFMNLCLRRFVHMKQQLEESFHFADDLGMHSDILEFTRSELEPSLLVVRWYALSDMRKRPFGIPNKIQCDCKRWNPDRKVNVIAGVSKARAYTLTCTHCQIVERFDVREGFSVISKALETGNGVNWYRTIMSQEACLEENGESDGRARSTVVAFCRKPNPRLSFAIPRQMASEAVAIQDQTECQVMVVFFSHEIDRGPLSLRYERLLTFKMAKSSTKAASGVTTVQAAAGGGRPNANKTPAGKTLPAKQTAKKGTGATKTPAGKTVPTKQTAMNSTGAKAPRRGTEKVDVADGMDVCVPEKVDAADGMDVCVPEMPASTPPSSGVMTRGMTRVRAQAQIAVNEVVGFEMVIGVGPVPDGATDDYCSVCNDGGNMRSCNGCSRSFDEDCLPLGDRDEFWCPSCAGMKYPYTGKKVTNRASIKEEEIIRTHAVYNSMHLLPRCNSEPLMLLNFVVAGYDVSYPPTVLVFHQVKHYLRSNVVMVNIPFSLLNADEEEEFAKRMADLVDKLENELKKFRRFAVFITTHSDPERGDLHVVAGNRCSDTTKKCFGFLFPARLRSILKERGRENIMFLLVCGAVVEYKESAAGIVELGKEDLFGSIVAFNQEKFQFVFASMFLMEACVRRFVHNKYSLADALHVSHSLGMHSDILEFTKAGVEGAERRIVRWYTLANPTTRPFGIPNEIQCKCGQWNPDRKTRVIAGVGRDKAYIVRCGECNFEKRWDVRQGFVLVGAAFTTGTGVTWYQAVVCQDKYLSDAKQVQEKGSTEGLFASLLSTLKRLPSQRHDQNMSTSNAFIQEKLPFELFEKICKATTNCPCCLSTVCKQFKEVCSASPLWNAYFIDYSEPYDIELARKWLTNGKSDEVEVVVVVHTTDDDDAEELAEFLGDVCRYMRFLSLTAFDTFVERLGPTWSFDSLVDLTLKIEEPLTGHPRTIADFSSCQSLIHVRLVGAFFGWGRVWVELPWDNLETLALRGPTMSMEDGLRILGRCANLSKFSCSPSRSNIVQSRGTSSFLAIPCCAHLKTFFVEGWCNMDKLLNADVMPNVRELVITVRAGVGYDEEDLPVMAQQLVPSWAVALVSLHMEFGIYSLLEGLINHLGGLPTLEDVSFWCRDLSRGPEDDVFLKPTKRVLAGLDGLKIFTFQCWVGKTGVEAEIKGLERVDRCRVRWILAGIVVVDTAVEALVGEKVDIAAQIWEGLPCLGQTFAVGAPFQGPCVERVIDGLAVHKELWTGYHFSSSGVDLAAARNWISRNAGCRLAIAVTLRGKGDQLLPFIATEGNRMEFFQMRARTLGRVKDVISPTTFENLVELSLCVDESCAFGTELVVVDFGACKSLRHVQLVGGFVTPGSQYWCLEIPWEQLVTLHLSSEELTVATGLPRLVACDKLEICVLRGKHRENSSTEVHASYHFPRLRILQIMAFFDLEGLMQPQSTPLLEELMVSTYGWPSRANQGFALHLVQFLQYNAATLVEIHLHTGFIGYGLLCRALASLSLVRIVTLVTGNRRIEHSCLDALQAFVVTVTKKLSSLESLFVDHGKDKDWPGYVWKVKVPSSVNFCLVVNQFLVRGAVENKGRDSSWMIKRVWRWERNWKKDHGPLYVRPRAMDRNEKGRVMFFGQDGCAIVNEGGGCDERVLGDFHLQRAYGALEDDGIDTLGSSEDREIVRDQMIALQTTSGKVLDEISKLFEQFHGGGSLSQEWEIERRSPGKRRREESDSDEEELSQKAGKRRREESDSDEEELPQKAKKQRKANGDDQGGDVEPEVDTDDDEQGGDMEPEVDEDDDEQGGGVEPEVDEDDDGQGDGVEQGINGDDDEQGDGEDQGKRTRARKKSTRKSATSAADGGDGSSTSQFAVGGNTTAKENDGMVTLLLGYEDYDEGRLDELIEVHRHYDGDLTAFVAEVTKSMKTSDRRMRLIELDQCLRFSQKGEDGRAVAFRLVQGVAELKYAKGWNNLNAKEKEDLRKDLWKKVEVEAADRVEKMVGNERTINKMRNVTLTSFKTKLGKMTTARNRLVAVFRLFGATALLEPIWSGHDADKVVPQSRYFGAAFREFIRVSEVKVTTLAKKEDEERGEENEGSDEEDEGAGEKTEASLVAKYLRKRHDNSDKILRALLEAFGDDSVVGLYDQLLRDYPPVFAWDVETEGAVEIWKHKGWGNNVKHYGRWIGELVYGRDGTVDVMEEGVILTKRRMESRSEKLNVRCGILLVYERKRPKGGDLLDQFGEWTPIFACEVEADGSYKNERTSDEEASDIEHGLRREPGWNEDVIEICKSPYTQLSSKKNVHFSKLRHEERMVLACWTVKRGPVIRRYKSLSEDKVIDGVMLGNIQLPESWIAITFGREERSRCMGSLMIGLSIQMRSSCKRVREVHTDSMMGKTASASPCIDKTLKRWVYASRNSSARGWI